MVKKVGLLFDSISANTGDKAIGLVMTDFLKKQSISFDIIPPRESLSLQSNYDLFLIGGGHLIRSAGDGFYDTFRVPGRHILNTVGVLAPNELEYLEDYLYLSVRSLRDKAKLPDHLQERTHVLPCVSLLFNNAGATRQIRPGQIGVHFHSATIQQCPDLLKAVRQFSRNELTFIPFTHYNSDDAIMLQYAENKGQHLPRLEARELYHVIGQLRLFICSSLHAAIFAYSQNIPFLVYPYDEKITAFMEERGLAHSMFFSTTDLQEKIKHVLAKKPDYTTSFEKDAAAVQVHFQRMGAILQAYPEAHIASLVNTEARFNLLWQQTNHVLEQKKDKIEQLQKTLSITERNVKRSLRNLANQEQQLAIEEKKLERTQRQLRDTKTALKTSLAQWQQEQVKKDTIVHELTTHLRNITQSKTWKLLQWYVRWRKRIVRFGILTPPLLWKGLVVLGTQGPVVFWKKMSLFFAGGRPAQQYILPDINQQYQQWIAKKEPLLWEKVKKLSRQPLISILIPVYNIDPKILGKTLESVLAQTYPKWQLCLVDDGSKNQVQLKKLLQGYIKKDARITVVYLPRNQGISTASNQALALAKGEYSALLDHDDILAPQALYENVAVINRHPKSDVIYSDEDKLDKNGQRVEPYFKPDWSPDLFLSNMYTSHLGVYRTELVRQVGGFRKGYESSQDYDLFLRILDKKPQIYHLPKILYHWRKIAGSTAETYAAKSSAQKSSIKALQDYMTRQKTAASVLPGRWPGSFYVKRNIVTEDLVSIIIPFRDQSRLLKSCLESIMKKTTYPRYEILLVNNQSHEPTTRQYLANLKKENIRLFSYSKPFNFSAINNFAATRAKGKYLLFLNNDTEVINTDWLQKILEQGQRQEVGVVGAKLLYADDSVQHAGVILGIGGVAGHAHKYYPARHHGYFYRLDVIQNFSAVTGACLLTPKKLFDALGGFNEQDLAIAFNDVDYCLRVREQGYSIVYTPYAQLYHYESKSRGLEDTPEKQSRFARECQYMEKKWGSDLQHDPYYSPHLTLSREDFSLRLE